MSQEPDVLLRLWRTADADALLASIAASPDLAPQFGGTPPADLEAAEVAIAELARADDSRQNFAIEFDGHAVGNVGISNIEHTHDTGWLYYWVAAPYRGRRLASRGLTAVASWAFDHHHLYRLELAHRVNNPASCAVAEAAGFAAEGIERAKLRYGTERFDVETHARLADDPAPGDVRQTSDISRSTVTI